MAANARRQRSSPDIWPGFVDAMATLLIIVIFLLMVFTLAQHFMSQALSGRNEALERLNLQVAELGEMLALERGANASLRQDMSQLTEELQSSITERERISFQLGELLPENDALKVALAESAARNERLLAELAAGKAELSAAGEANENTKAALAAKVAETDKVSRELEDAGKVIAADREKIALQLRTLEGLRRDIAALRTVRAALEKKVVDMALTLDDARTARAALEKKMTGMASTLDDARRDLTAVRDRSKELEARLSSEQERTALAQRSVSEKDLRLIDLAGRAKRATADLADEKKISATAHARLALLNRQIAALRQQLARIATALEASEAKAREQNVQIVNLGQRLNAALASKVEELSRYRSEFFGKLREVLGDQKGIRVVGDRFVFQSEVLFASGSADLAEGGLQQIERLATTLKEIARRIPDDVDWVLRVDGHTDRIPIRTAKFPSNWELSTGRAILVVKHLSALGIPPERLAATGFGQFRPIDSGTGPAAHRRNRRIEFKLTGR